VTSIFIFGDSHTRALKDAHNNFKFLEPSLNLNIHWMLSVKNGMVRGDLRYEDALTIASNLSENDLLVISLLGTSHNLFGLIEHEIPFFFSDADQSEHNGPEKHLIPFNLMYDMFVEFSKKNKRIPELRKATKAKVIHLMTPPPKGDNDFIKSKISRYRDKVLGEHSINSPTIRLKLWQIEMQALQNVCEEYGIYIVPTPEPAFDTGGFLRADYYGGDATHANMKYGKLVLSQLEKLLNRSIM